MNAPPKALTVTSDVLRQISALRETPKFHGERECLCPGAPTEEIRLAAEQAVNAMLDRLQAGLPRSPQKAYALAEFLEMLKAFEHEETEEREQACVYCERVMKVLGIESSDGLLNTWLYGFDPERKP